MRSSFTTDDRNAEYLSPQIPRIVWPTVCLYATLTRNPKMVALFMHGMVLQSTPRNDTTGFVRNLLEPLKDGRVKLLLNAGDHASMQNSLKKCLEELGIGFKVIGPPSCLACPAVPP